MGTKINLEQTGTCNINIRGKVRENWPCYGRIGYWCITPPVRVNGRNAPNLTHEWFAITHHPTGLRACDVRVDDPGAMKVLAKFAQMFGSAYTVSGVMRKYRALTPQQRAWIKRQVSWLLPESKVTA